MLAVLKKELNTYFRNPLGYVFIGMMMLIMGFYYSYYTLYYQKADYYYVLNACTSLILFVIPVLTMRLMSEERKNKTDQLLLTSPISTFDMVLGKYLAAVVLYLIVIVVSFLQPLTTIIVFKGKMATEMLIGGYIAFLTMGIAFIAMGMFISTITENQLVAAVITIALFSVLMLTEGLYAMISTSRYVSLGCLLAILAGVLVLIYNSIKDIMTTAIVGVAGLLGILVTFFIVPSAFDSLINNILKSLSIFTRYSGMFSGKFAFADIIFFLSLAAFFVWMTYQTVERRRWN
ncbi:MAG: ABC transporter permease [Lachnospiraceae bacterium]|nr:ABC transporter permease [Lachnospiraceae bacterium]